MPTPAPETSNDNIEDIRTRLINAKTSDDTAGIVQCLYDLEDAGWKNVSITTRYVGVKGERIELQIWLRGGMCIIAPGTRRVFRLIWKLRFKAMINRKDYKWIKHQNEIYVPRGI